jgi:hypothetical protein
VTHGWAAPETDRSDAMLAGKGQAGVKVRALERPGPRQALDHDDFGLNQSKIMNVIDS